MTAELSGTTWPVSAGGSHSTARAGSMPGVTLRSPRLQDTASHQGGSNHTPHTHTHRYSRTYNTGEWTNKQESCESYDMNLQSFSVPARAGKWLQTELIHSSSVWSAVNQTAGLIFTQFITAALPVTVPQTRTAATQQVLLKRFFPPPLFNSHSCMKDGIITWLNRNHSIIVGMSNHKYLYSTVKSNYSNL